MRTRHPSRSLCFALLLAFSAGSPLAATPAATSFVNCGAAGCVPANWGPGQIAAGFGVGGFQPGQTFAPAITGVVVSVRLGLETSGVIAAIAEIRPTVNGLPTNTVLASAPVPGAPYTAGVLYTADFAPSNLVLTAGTRYAVTLRANAPQLISILAAFPACAVATTGTHDYVHSDDFGQTWAKLATRDRSIIYQVCLDAATPARADTWGRVKAIYR